MVNTNALTNDMHVLGCRGCCNYPNGKMGIAAVCVSVIGFILATSATYTCNFFKVEFTDSYGYPSYVNIGLFSAGVEVCFSYSSYELEFTTAWKFARAMAILATILGVPALVGTLSLSCMLQKNVLKIISILYLISALCVILTLVMKADCMEDYDGNNLCKFGPGAALAIVAPFFYVASAIIIFKIPIYEYHENETNATEPEHASGKNVKIEITEFPDGSKKTVKTIIDENGNTIIEETIEVQPEVLHPEEAFVVATVLPNAPMETTDTTFDEDDPKFVIDTTKPDGQYGEWEV